MGRQVHVLISLLLMAAKPAQCFQVHTFKNTLWRSELLSHPLSAHQDDEQASAGQSWKRPLLDRRSAILSGGTIASSLLVFPSSTPAAGKTTGKNEIPSWTLDNGVQMPTLALNTVGLSAAETTRAVRSAVDEGMVHVDFHPGKERDGVAAYIQQRGREGLFLNTKIRKAPPGTSPDDAAELARKQIAEDLKVLNVPSVDMLMLRDSPDCAVMQAQWAVLEDALKTGKTRSIGVINFCEKALTCLLETAKVTPALNYYM